MSKMGKLGLTKYNSIVSLILVAGHLPSSGQN